ncbi:hypothetical protein TUM4438_40340 [Shewanella sairae]|uniref:Type II/III secretion system secretin-like domain-containing protein n=1 Tax=Shewanella sairae TaxID=190310 RepID=A0ABQ4PQA4_9GAMM|nr:hypothetical protein [Shewanella sairae]MCL1132238.1 hypothetical protein [Shewanella sairae]GIU51280.1 hypothetical protein TUM4438_40340 [Shewanella sairae]
MRLPLLIIAMTAALSGCMSQNYQDTKQDADSVHEAIESHLATSATSQVMNITRPPLTLEPLKTERQISWLNESVSINVDGLPLSLVLSQLMAGVDANIWFDGDVNPNKPVTLSFKSSRQDVLNLLSRETGYGMNATKDKLSVSKFESETFVISLPVGQYSGQLGSQSGGQDTKVTGQFLNTAYSQVDVVTEISQGIKAILKDDENEDEDKLIGSVEVIPSMTTIAVRTTPDRMVRVRALVDSFEAELSKQVFLDIRVLEFRSNKGRERGIDWNLVKDIGGGSLEFYIPGTNTITQGGSAGLAFKGTGKWDGTTALIKALEKQGTVSTETPITALVLNNQPSRIAQTLTTPYLYEVKAENNGDIVTASVTRAIEKEGVDMMITPKVMRDHVWLRIAGKLTKIVSDKEEVVYDASLRFLDTRESELNFTNKLRYGQTVVLGSIKQMTTTAEHTKQFGVDALGGEGTQLATVETLVLLTPKRVE